MATAAMPPPTYSLGMFFFGGGGGATASFFSSAGAAKIGTMHCGLQHLTCLPAALRETKPFVSHMGQTTSRGLPGPGWRLTGMALAATDGSIANGSSSAAGAAGSSSIFSGLPRPADGLAAMSGDEPVLEDPGRADGALTA